MDTEDATRPGQRLAKYVVDRRKELDMTQRALIQASGLGKSTIESIERGDTDERNKATRDGLDRALWWAPGSTRTTLNGGVPEPLPRWAWENDLEALRFELQATETEIISLTIRAGGALSDGDEATRLELQRRITDLEVTRDRLRADVARRVERIRATVSGSGDAPPIATAGGRGEGWMPGQRDDVLAAVLEMQQAMNASLAKVVEALQPRSEPDEP